jgi:hypothetical protein
MTGGLKRPRVNKSAAQVARVSLFNSPILLSWQRAIGHCLMILKRLLLLLSNDILLLLLDLCVIVALANVDPRVRVNENLREINVSKLI